MTYNASGQIVLTAVAGTSLTGLYAADGSYNVVLTTENTTYKGIYHPCGAWWGTVATSPVTFYAIDGSINIVSDGGSGYVLAFPNNGSGSAPTTFYLLQEDGSSRIILEDGSGFLVLEH